MSELKVLKKTEKVKTSSGATYLVKVPCCGDIYPLTSQAIRRWRQGKSTKCRTCQRELDIKRTRGEKGRTIPEEAEDKIGKRLHEFTMLMYRLNNA